MKHYKRRWKTALILLVGLSASTVGLAESRSQAPFRAAPGLFKTDDKTLGLNTIRGQHTLLFRATDDGYKFCHHANLVVFRERLYCMWSNGIVHEDQPGQRVVYSTSSDGITWTPPTVLTEPTIGKGVYVAAGFHVFDDTVTAFYTVTAGQNFHPDTALFARTSRDGRTWGEPRRIAGGFFIAGPRRLPGGRLLLSGDQVGDHRKTKRMTLLYTDQPDGLGGWQEARIGLRDPNVFGYTEPNPFWRADGTIVMPFRNQSGFLYASVSTDQGRSWTVPVKTNFPDSMARFCPGRLPDETVFLINNPGPTKLDRSRLTIALSPDGEVFDRAFLLRGEPTKKRYEGKSKLDGWQYPHAIVWKDHLYVAYSINKEDVAVTRIALKDLARRRSDG